MLDNLKMIGGLVVFFGLSAVVSTCSNRMRWADVRADQIEQAELDESSLLGFAGYAYGSGDLFIEDDMRAKGWEPISHTSTGIWYAGTMWGYDCEFGYIFYDGLMIGGGINFHDASDDAFIDVADELYQVYGLDAEVTYKESVLVHVFHSEDSLIMHSVDQELRDHNIVWTQLEGLE